MSSSSLLLLLLLHLPLLFLPSLASDAASPSRDITVYEVLPKYGLPPGILPDTVKSFSIASNGSFVVDLFGECYVDFEYLVYYYPRVSGVVRYGAIEDLEGVQVRRFFIWLNVDAIRVDPDDPDNIEFVVGWLTRKLRIDQFQTVHSCKGNHLSMLGRAKKVARSMFELILAQKCPNVPENGVGVGVAPTTFDQGLLEHGDAKSPAPTTFDQGLLEHGDAKSSWGTICYIIMLKINYSVSELSVCFFSAQSRNNAPPEAASPSHSISSYCGDSSLSNFVGFFNNPLVGSCNFMI
ncbi:hypothetical protein Cni_G16800 [Canna indica]|uniref:Uncharacterized protein n=1 Tax=Canna indica TaxID=4628 RepID=A0AAQ3KJ76_9LILI|nr:hypothetical protein Cni_G16800 [Canna indica]